MTVKNHESSASIIRYGVPQGSVLGPLLFVLYTKPISDITTLHNIPCQQFADDTQLQNSCSYTNIPLSITKVQNCFSDIKSWMTSNKLKLNDDKSEILLIHSKFKKLPLSCPQSILMGKSELTFSSEARNLGVIFTDTLDLNKHINNVCRSAYCEIRRISSVRHLLSVDDTKQLVCSYVLSKLDYCNSLLCNLSKANINKLQKVQNSAARLIFRIKKYDHITPYLRELHWLPIYWRIQFKISLLCFKSFTDPKFPSYISELLDIYHPKRCLRSSSDNRLLNIPKCNTTFGKRSFSYSAPSTWNALPFTLRHSASESIFKKSLKTYLFQKAYET